MLPRASADENIGFVDALFTAQDHPVREMQDTFYLKDMKGKLPEDEKKKVSSVLADVQKAHEGGIVKEHKGTIACRSNDGGGTTISFSLPHLPEE